MNGGFRRTIRITLARALSAAQISGGFEDGLRANLNDIKQAAPLLAILGQDMNLGDTSDLTMNEDNSMVCTLPDGEIVHMPEDGGVLGRC